eukprot:12306612-Alexandrium_andersonii.AAC.1
MSASLVGSEMCIRDRTPLHIPGRAGSRVPTDPSLPLRTAHSQPRPRPVSYTHLTLPTICSV